MSFLSEFKSFAMRGNVIDLAVAVVIGAAFGKIVASLVDGIIMPLIGMLIGGIDISGQTVTIGHAVLKWGFFLQTVIDFALIAFSIFLVIKLISTFKKKKPAEPAGPTEIQLLSEIRDILSKK